MTETFINPLEKKVKMSKKLIKRHYRKSLLLTKAKLQSKTRKRNPPQNPGSTDDDFILKSMSLTVS